MSFSNDGTRRVVVVGATRNFFKVGHRTLRILARTRPDVRLRLGIPDIENARLACEDIDVELISWEPARPHSLHPVLADCDSMLMVPPIDGRVQVATTYIEAAASAGVKYILCLGVQHSDGPLTLTQEAEEVKSMLTDSGIPNDVLRLPMFLENLLYQVPSIFERGTFTFPVDPDAAFSYLTCADLGEVFARLLLDPPPPGALDEAPWTGADQLTCAGWANALSSALGKPVTFERQADRQFVDHLMAKGMSPHAANGVLQLWQMIDNGNDVAPTDAFAGVLGRPSTSAVTWADDHACCFSTGPTQRCIHPRPPYEHMF